MDNLQYSPTQTYETTQEQMCFMIYIFIYFLFIHLANDFSQSQNIQAKPFISM